jgi:phospholipase/carboxylesterase
MSQSRIVPITSTLQHIVLDPEADTRTPHPTVIMLHGLGADEHDLAGLAQFLDSRLLTISVRAPFPLAWGGYTWYDFSGAGKPDPVQFKESSERLLQFIHDALAHYPVDPRHLYLLGFSMGTVMALAMALSQPQLFHGVIANSGYLAEGTHLTYRWGDVKGKNFYVAHGVHDELIPVQASRIIRSKLEAAGARVEYHEFPMAHEIAEPSLNAMARWLTTQIDERGD